MILKLRNIWNSMHTRCYTTHHRDYKWYGAKGVRIADCWLHDYDAFEAWSLEHGWQEGLHIDRIDTTGPYAPDNCRWITNSENQQTRRTCQIVTFRGAQQNIVQVCDTLHIDRNRVYHYVRQGMSYQDAIDILEATCSKE